LDACYAIRMADQLDMKKITPIIVILVFLVGAFLRIWQISRVPISLFGDELDVGYQAYSILKTGKDYYGNFLPIHFHSLAEWRTPLYLYSSVPTVALFGISPLGVRLPAAIFGILSIFALYLLVKEITKNHRLALLASFVMAISPWHLQYSRAGFEATQLLFLLILGLYFFFKALETKGKMLWVSVGLLALTPWVYSTAKLFTPLLLLFLLWVWRKEIFSFSQKHLFYAILSLFIIGGPIAYSTFFGGGTQRFNNLSIFNDPVLETEIGALRQVDVSMQGQTGKVFHNKLTYWGGNFIRNYFQSFSTEFLFIKGDLNLRQSIGTGEFYRVDALVLILGLIFFFTKFPNRKFKSLIAFWILVGVVPAALTRDGGNHATRLILILPPLIFLIAYGLMETYKALAMNYRKLFVLGYGILLFICFIGYQHTYWVHYPLESERWWHAGFKESIQAIKSIDKNYDKVVISTANEPPWIFFAAWYEYPPVDWQKNFPIGNDVELPGFGKVSHIGKFYFGSPQKDVGIYEIEQYIDSKTLYLAVASEIGANLIIEPQRTPPGLKLVKAISYLSGEPAFYLFAGNKI